MCRRVVSTRLVPARAAEVAGGRTQTLEPLTGRTHQLRVHCSALGFAILGDPIYGSGPRAGGPPLHLHAREIIVPISKNKAPVRAVAPAPDHMRERLRACGWDGVEEPAPAPQEQGEGQSASAD